MFLSPIPIWIILLIYQVLWVLGAVFLSPFWLLAFAFVPKFRAGFWQKMGCIPSALQARLRNLDRQRPVVWIHAVSVGEFLAIKPLAQSLLDAQMNVVISTTTQTGQRLAQDSLGDSCIVFYFPYDFSFAVLPWLRAIRPDLVMITETELWPYFLGQVGGLSSTALYLINGRLSDKSFQKYQWIKPFLSPVLSRIDHAYMQTQADTNRLKSLLLPERRACVSTMGNLKFDVPLTTTSLESTERLKTLFNFPEGTVVLTMASTHEGEEALLLQVCYELFRDFPELRFVLAPRHPERITQVSKLLREETFRYRLRSSLSPQHPNQDKMVLVDTIGELKDIFAFSNFAIVAGSFLPHLGGHNILEPLMTGTPVLFGPYVSNFKEIVYTVHAYEAGIQVQDMLALKHAIVALMTQTQEAERLRNAGFQLLAAHQGQTQQLVEAIQKQLHWRPENL